MKNKFMKMINKYRIAKATLLTVALTLLLHFNEIHALHTKNFFPNELFLVVWIIMYFEDSVVNFLVSKLPKKWGIKK
jgi:hypothetical protein